MQFQTQKFTVLFCDQERAFCLKTVKITGRTRVLTNNCIMDTVIKNTNITFLRRVISEERNNKNQANKQQQQKEVRQKPA